MNKNLHDMNIGVEFSRKAQGNPDECGKTLALGRGNVPARITQTAEFRGFLPSFWGAFESE
jgi:hypothetical protein